MNPEDPILEFADVVLPLEEMAGHPPLLFSLRAGEWAAIETTEHLVARAIADLAQGLLDPAAGEVRFLGRPWPRIPHEESCRLRGMDIGRVFSSAGWVSNLDMDENLTLAGRHFDPRPEPELLADARAAVQRMGLADIPAGRPAWIAPRLLQITQWARALQGPRRLVVLELPLRKTHDADARTLADALRSAARGGAAVLWIGPGAHILDREWKPAAQVKLIREAVVPAQSPDATA